MFILFAWSEITLGFENKYGDHFRPRFDIHKHVGKHSIERYTRCTLLDRVFYTTYKSCRVKEVLNYTRVPRKNYLKFWDKISKKALRPIMPYCVHA